MSPQVGAAAKDKTLPPHLLTSSPPHKGNPIDAHHLTREKDVIVKSKFIFIYIIIYININLDSLLRVYGAIILRKNEL